MDTADWPCCIECDVVFDPRRQAMGYDTCLTCGDQAAAAERKGWCVAPMHKSNYTLVTNRDELVGLNNKGGIVRNSV